MRPPLSPSPAGRWGCPNVCHSWSRGTFSSLWTQAIMSPCVPLQGRTSGMYGRIGAICSVSTKRRQPRPMPRLNGREDQPPDPKQGGRSAREGKACGIDGPVAPRHCPDREWLPLWNAIPGQGLARVAYRPSRRYVCLWMASVGLSDQPMFPDSP